MQQERHFTLEEADMEIAWLEPQLRRIAELRKELAGRNGDLHHLLRQSRSNGHGELGQQITSKRREVSDLADRLANLMQEVHDRGIILRDPDQGLVDFPSLREGREVYLCWLLGEEQVRHWHGVDTEFASRQPL